MNETGDMIASPNDSVSSMPKPNEGIPPAATVLVHDIIRERAKSQPTAEAICSWDYSLSYEKLDSLSSRLAGHITSNGVGPEIVVPLVFEKSCWAVVGMLAVMKAGGAFLPMDVSQPQSRLRSIIEETGAKFALSSGAQYEFCSSIVENTFAVTELALADLTTAVCYPHTELSDAAYVMSTSGSAGTPKIVVTEHSQLASFVAYLAKPLGFTGKTRTLQFASYAFDPIIGDIFLTLATGGTVCIPSEDERKNDIVGAIRRMQVSLAKFTPSFVGALGDLTPASVPTLRTLVLGGEVATPAVIKAWSRHVDLKLIYGSTECTISCVVTDASIRAVIPGEIGTPVGSQAWVIDPNDVNRLVEDGEVGELMIGGPLVSRGYRNHLSQTKSKFVSPPPWLAADQSQPRQGFRLYRTGDLVRRAKNGNLLYVGRVDNQIKIRGQRLELEDVEQHLRCVLAEMTNIRTKEILVDAAAPVGIAPKQLVAFLCVVGNNPIGSLLLDDEKGATLNISPSTQQEFSMLVSEVEASLKSKVPLYMVPTLWIPIHEMPYTLSRKKDRQRLRKAIQSLPMNWLTLFSNGSSKSVLESRQDTRALTENERLLQTLWSELLGTEVGVIHPVDNFFHLGGDSLLALKLISMARQKGQHFTVDDIFSSPILQDLATKLAPARVRNMLASFTLLDNTQTSVIQNEAVEQCGASLDSIEDIYPLYSMQEHYITGYLELGRDLAGPWDWQQQIVFLLPFGFDIPRFKEAWDFAVKRHSQLRTRVIRTRYGMFQVVLREELSPHWKDVGDLQEYIREDNAAVMSFGDELLRLAIATSGQRHYFIFTIQHLLYDAYSRDLLFRELEEVYQRQTSLPRAPPPQMNQFISYVKNADRKSAIDFWSSYLEGSITRPLLSVPIGSHPVSKLHIYKTTLDKPPPLPSWKWTMATILEVGTALALAARLHCPDIIFYSDRAGRNLSVDGIQDLVAPTTLFLPTRVHIDRAQIVYDLLCVHQAATAAMIPFEHLNWTELREIEHLKDVLAHSVNLNINPSTLFSNLGENIGLQVVEEHETRDDPFNISVSVNKDTVEWDFYYDKDFISHSTVEDLGVDLKESLLAVWEACEGKQITVGDVMDRTSTVAQSRAV